jgi:ABC-type multidrug transport system permease subunit
MLHNTHHSPEDMLTPMDPRWKSIVLLRSQQGYHGYQSSSPIPLLTGPSDGDNDKRHDKKNTKTNLSSMSLQNGPIQDWIRLYLGYGDSTVIQDDNWAVYINGVKQETLRQKRRRHLIASQHDQYALLHDYRSMNETDPDRVHEYRTSTQLNGSKIWNYALFPQSTHIYQQLFYPDEDSGSTYPPPPNPSYLSTVQYQALELHSNGQLFDIDEVLIERENKRLALITDTYLKYPIQPNHSLSPFLSNYIPKLRVLDKEGAVALQEIGFDFQIKGLGGGKKSKTAPDKEARRKIDIVQPGKAALPWVDQLKVLTHRTFLHTVRDPLNTVARIGVNLLLSFFVGLLFFQTGDSQKSLYARVGFLFFMTSIQAFITVMGAVLTFSEERALFIREYHKQIYATSSYFLGRTIIDVIMQTVLSVLFGSLAYPMVGLRPSFMTFVKYTICLIMVAQGTHSYALVLGAIIPYRTVALMLSPVVMVPFLTVSGFLAPLNQLSPAISWLTWFSPQRWMFEAMMNLELIDLAFQCRPAEFITVPLDNGTMEKVCPILTGKAVLSLFGLSANPNTFIINVIACVIIAVVIKVVALGALKFSAWWTIRNSTGA